MLLGQARPLMEVVRTASTAHHLSEPKLTPPWAQHIGCKLHSTSGNFAPCPISIACDQGPTVRQRADQLASVSDSQNETSVATCLLHTHSLRNNMRPCRLREWT